MVQIGCYRMVLIGGMLLGVLVQTSHAGRVVEIVQSVQTGKWLCDQWLWVNYTGSNEAEETNISGGFYLLAGQWQDLPLFRKNMSNGCIKTYVAQCRNGGIEVKKECTGFRKVLSNTFTRCLEGPLCFTSTRKSDIQEGQAIEFLVEEGQGIHLTSGVVQFGAISAGGDPPVTWEPYDASNIVSDVTTYILGDSHGDENYLSRQLLSTGKFVVEQGGKEGSAALSLQWRKTPKISCCCCMEANESSLCNDSDALFTPNEDGSGICCKIYMGAVCNSSGDYQVSAQDTYAKHDWIAAQHNSAHAMCHEQVETDFRIVIAGDIVDRGSRSREGLELVRRLQQDERFGSKLIFLLGNHESFLLRYGFAPSIAYAYKWAWNARVLFHAKLGSNDYNFLQWLRSQPIMYRRDQMLVMHGGLVPQHMFTMNRSLNIAGKPTNAQAIVDEFNQKAKRYYEGVFNCVTDHIHKKTSPKDCGWNVPYWLENVLEERTFTSADHGAGSLVSCKLAATIGRELNIHSIALAHTTHPRIMKFCGQHTTPVYAIDTSYKLCQFGKEDGDKECDFSLDRNLKRSRSTFLPSSLQVSRRGVMSCVYDQDSWEEAQCSRI